MTQPGGGDPAGDDDDASDAGELGPSIDGEQAIDGHDADFPEGASLTAQYHSENVRVSRGVLTDPQSLREYEATFPGAGKMILDRYFAEVEAEQQHRRAMDRLNQQTEAGQVDRILTQGDRGQWMAFVVAVFGLVLTAFLALLGQPELAGVLLVVDLGGLVGVFIYGKKKQAAAASETEQEEE